jgi:hypothetical protein
MRVYIGRFSKLEKVNIFLARKQTFNFFTFISLDGFGYKSNLGKGQNYENHNIENQKELRKLRRRSERRNGLLS